MLQRLDALDQSIHQQLARCMRFDEVEIGRFVGMLQAFIDTTEDVYDVSDWTMEQCLDEMDRQGFRVFVGEFGQPVITTKTPVLPQ